MKYVLAAVFGIGVSDGYATVYGTPGDPLDGDVLACNEKAIPQDAPLCAHRYLPCGTEITVVNVSTQRVATCTVADRGPYGLSTRGRWRGIVDLTPGAASRLGVTGRDAVRMVYRFPMPPHRMYGRTYWLEPRVNPALQAAGEPDDLMSTSRQL